ncbi:MAG: hypothetical protein EA339_03795 [Rhodobacteraceae bacterium]|nr:MAG: hypothetical protein EA339_03795 [Paracoccaceae bacterium]
MKQQWIKRVAALALGGAALATAGLAQTVEAEQFELDGVSVTVFAQDFLTEEEVMTLRLVGQNRDALAVFVTAGEGFAALAVAPQEGFVRGGVPVASASALSGLPDLGAARAAALEACDAARDSAEACAVVLEIAPR